MKAPLKNKTDRCMFKQWDYDYNAFGAAIRAARKKKNLTQRTVSRICACARSTVWRMEMGAAVNPATMVRACELLDVDLMKYNTKPSTK